MVAALTTSLVALVLLTVYRWRTVTKGSSGPAAQVPILERYACTIAPGIYLLGGLTPAAAYVVETADGLVLIDTGLAHDAASLEAEMGSLSLDWRRVHAIFLTHAHGDHSGGAEHLRTATGAKVYAGRGDADVLRNGRPREAFFSLFDMPQATVEPTHVDVELSGEQVITVGDVQFHAIATPGHTPGSMCYLMERGGQRVLFAGDVIMSLLGHPGSHARMARPLGTYAAYLAPRYRGDAQAFLSTLHRLRSLPAPQLVLPGHPQMDPVPQSPLMSQTRWGSMLDAGIREMERLQARYARDGRGFLDGVPKQLLPEFYYFGEFKGQPVYGFFANSRFFLVDAPGGPGLDRFVMRRSQKLGIKSVAPSAVLLTSGNRDETAGLAAIIKRWSTLVVVAPAAWKVAKAVCPTGTKVVAPEALAAQGWLRVTPILLGGRAPGTVAYQLPRAGKTVLCSGRIPIRLTPATVLGLATDLSHGLANAHDYQVSLMRLGRLHPDVWLPALPGNGENANLYDSEWQDILAQNGNLFR